MTAFPFTLAATLVCGATIPLAGSHPTREGAELAAERERREQPHFVSIAIVDRRDDPRHAFFDDDEPIGRTYIRDETGDWDRCD